MNEKRKKFIKTFAVQVKGIMSEKFNKENEDMKPTLGELADGYRSFISDLGEGFLEVVEKYNECLQIARNNGLINNVKLKARIKDFSSSLSNTEEKLLDDVFGMELVTGKDVKDLEKEKRDLTEVEAEELQRKELEQAELQKEILVLFNHLIFNISKDKIYNKKSGYNAYHGMGDLLPKEGELKDIIRQIVNQTKTIEYKYSKNEPNYSNKKNMVNVFPRLIKYIENPKNLEKLADALSKMIEHMKAIKTPIEGMPIIEFHFLTSEAEERATIGSASHSNYKKINPTLIEKYFLSGRLIRGINAPWTFESNGENIVLQDFYETVGKNWLFLADEIEEKRKLGKEGRENERIFAFDRLTATVFPFFRKYLSASNKYDNKIEENWGLLKAILIANRIDFRNKTTNPIEDDIMRYIGQEH